MPWLDDSVTDLSLQLLRRAAAGGDEYSDQLDYTVLSVAVITLGLILIVELIRHRLDVAATGRPFFKSVLGGVYRELATLGIVEFIIFLLHKYYENLNVAQELVFADIHFTLFFTALFNALQSVLLAVVATRNSTQLWVRTEELEVDHYVEIREEFERVDALLYGDSTLDKSSRRSTRGIDVDAAEVPLEFNCHSMLTSFHSMTKFLRYPLLYRKHQQLLVQLRFHELRVHFMQSNDLPPRLKVSDYLKRCELHLLIKMVHITTFAWLILTGGIILVYFLMGIVVFVTSDVSKVAVSLTSIFLGVLVLFVVISLIIFNKMKAIFLKIMRQRLQTEEITGRHASRQQITSQVALFWGGNPKFIRVIIQFMQFGFALALAIMLVFWHDINVPEAPLNAGSILVIVVSCDAAFVFIMAQVLPRYTLCTSLGQLVNQQLLQETVAQYRLKEAQLKQELESNIECDDVSLESDDASRSSSVMRHPIESVRKVLSSTLRKGRHSERSKTFEDIDFSKSSSDAEISGENSSREQRVLDRGNRRKAVSEGVAMMRLRYDESAASALGDRALEKRVEPKLTDPPRQADFSHGSRYVPRSLSSPEAIEAMTRSSSFESLLLTQLVQTETKELRKNLNLLQHEQSLQRRRSRKKSMSDGVALMRLVRKEEEEDQKREQQGSDATSLTSTNNSSTVAPVRSQVLRRDRRRSVSASEAIQQMRDTAFSTESTQSSTKPKGRLPRSRQSSTGVPRLEPLVEGVPVQHSDRSVTLMPSIDVHHDNENVHPDMASTASDDKSTMATSTLGECRSDDDDIPDVDPTVRDAFVAEPKPRPSFSEIGRAYFESQRYRIISGVFGTMACFFLVGHRVESLLLTSCTMPNYENTWQIKGNVAFWMETIWLSVFMLVASIVMFLFRPSQAFTNRERVLFVSAMIDIALSSACLALLMVAESRRCCPEADQRFLAEALPLVGAGGYCNTPTDCCPSFGKRFYGGLGTIEPITSIIALRVLRFVIARKIVACLDNRYKWSDLDVIEGPQSEPPHPFNPLFSAKGARHKKLMEHETGTAIELWKQAVALYPDIVKEYGEFSGELLQAMLGLERLKDTSESELDADETISKKDVEAPTVSPADKRVQAETSRRASMLVERKYSRLTPEAQSIILSGRLGKSVRKVNTEEDAGHRAATLPFGRKEPPVANVYFELETADDVVPQGDQTLSSFLAPDARLIRSMRRCDRRLLPLLNQWSAVDVVITKWEIVYLDASSAEDMQGAGYTAEEIRTIEVVRQAVIATKGGKGLRLRDVAMGRKVVGHLGLSAVDAIHVERILHPDNAEYDEQPASDDRQDIQAEFWKKSGSDGHPHLARKLRWARVKEDRLRIHSIHGTLFLRFYSDLDDSESHRERCVSERESEGSIFKNNAFQWCQTIVRLCGINQLKQKLQHFGDDDADELRDYLVVVDGRNFTDAPRHVRTKSFGNLLGHIRRKSTQAELPDIFEHIPARPPPLRENGGRASSFGESRSSSNGLGRSSRILRRHASTGDAPTSGGIWDAPSFASSGHPAPETMNSDCPSGPTGPDMV